MKEMLSGALRPNVHLASFWAQLLVCKRNLLVFFNAQSKENIGNIFINVPLAFDLDFFIYMALQGLHVYPNISLLIWTIWFHSNCSMTELFNSGCTIVGINNKKIITTRFQHLNRCIAGWTSYHAPSALVPTFHTMPIDLPVQNWFAGSWHPGFPSDDCNSISCYCYMIFSQVINSQARIFCMLSCYTKSLGPTNCSSNNSRYSWAFICLDEQNQGTMKHACHHMGYLSCTLVKSITSTIIWLIVPMPQIFLMLKLWSIYKWLVQDNRTIPSGR